MDNYQLIIQYILKYGTAVIFLLLFYDRINTIKNVVDRRQL